MPAPYYVLGIQKVLDGTSFTELFNWFVEELTKRKSGSKKEDVILKNAMNYTYRCFRSFKDTVYLEGYILQRKLEQLGLGHLNETGIWSPETFDVLAQELPHLQPIIPMQNAQGQSIAIKMYFANQSK